ncbi:MAG: hypothetical protein H0U59_12850 [Gemmatimonadaceae bacterium]|nr:hypothetical protein [Gemmatimonadaceae bacterium]
MADLTSWQSIQLPTLPEEVTTALEGITALGNATVSALQAVSAILDILAGVDINVDPAKATLKLAIEAIEAGLRSLLENAGVYVLFVPVRRKIIVSPLIQEALSAVGMPDVPPQRANIDMLVLQADLAAHSSEVIAFFNAPRDGGNAGFYRTVVESILDKGDSNRPLFGATDAVTGIHVVAGASDYVNILSLITALDALFMTGPANDGLAIPGLPVPQNLKAKHVITLTGLPGAYLSWDARAAFSTVPSLTASCLITEIAIIRSSNPDTLSVTTPLGLFGTNQLTKGMAAPGDPDTVVVDVLEYTLLSPPNTYDDLSGLVLGTQYHYFASFRFKLGDINALASGATFPDQGFYRFSNVAVMTAQARSQRSSRGTPPDWVRTPSVLSLVPQSGDLVNLLMATLAQYGASGTGEAESTAAYLRFLQKEIARTSAILGTLTGFVQRLTSIAGQTPHAGIYGRAYAGVGGTNYMLADLGASLAPTNTDPNRPPFDRGDEFVTGVVILAGAPTPAVLAPIQTMLQVMFSLEGPGAVSSLQQAITAIDAVLTAQEAASFTADFTVGPASAVEQSLTNPPLSDDDPGNVPVYTPPTFGDDFGVS